MKYVQKTRRFENPVAFYLNRESLQRLGLQKYQINISDGNRTAVMRCRKRKRDDDDQESTSVNCEGENSAESENVQEPENDDSFNLIIDEDEQPYNSEDDLELQEALEEHKKRVFRK